MNRIHGHKFYKFIHLPNPLPLFGNSPNYLDPLAGLRDYSRLSEEDRKNFFIKFSTRTKYLENRVYKSNKDQANLKHKLTLIEMENNSLSFELQKAKNLQRPAIDEFLFFMGLMALVAYSMELLYAIFT